MYTIVGSGFGLYGYLPALIALSEEVVLPRAFVKKIRARPELVWTLPRIRWVVDGDAALNKADSVIIATPPKIQEEVIEHCIALPHIEQFVLEKPLAINPTRASSLLAKLDEAHKRYVINYTMMYLGWQDTIEWPRNTSTSVDVTWTFMAHHFASGLHNWKRVHDEGGGVLRFYGIHLIAMLSHYGYNKVRSSRLEGSTINEPERWIAIFSGLELPECHVRVDSHSPNNLFEISSATSGHLLSLHDPFKQEPKEGGLDRRVSALMRLLRVASADVLQLKDMYIQTNKLWEQAEALS